jgi:hypothetical protein
VVQVKLLLFPDFFLFKIDLCLLLWAHGISCLLYFIASMLIVHFDVLVVLNVRLQSEG